MFTKEQIEAMPDCANVLTEQISKLAIECPACKKKQLRRWGGSVVCAKCGAQQLLEKDGTYKSYGLPP